MKVTIHRGASSIEVEGEFSEVERVLDRWWAHDAGTGATSALPDSAPMDQREEKNVRRPPRKPSRAPKVTVSGGTGFDADSIVNDIKNDPKFEKFLNKVILPKNTTGEKVKFVSWFSGDVPLTSGDVHRVLHQLGVKVDKSTISRAMTGTAKQEYLVDKSGSHPTYKLSIIGRSAFEQWLLDDASKA